MTETILEIVAATERLTLLLSLSSGQRTRGQVTAAAVALAALALRVVTDVAPALDPVTGSLCAVIGEMDAAADKRLRTLEARERERVAAADRGAPSIAEYDRALMAAREREPVRDGKPHISDQTVTMRTYPDVAVAICPRCYGHIPSGHCVCAVTVVRWIGGRLRP